MSAVQDRTCSGSGRAAHGLPPAFRGQCGQEGPGSEGRLHENTTKRLLEVDKGNLPSLMKGERLEGP